jgi:hypothetical protein
MLPLVGNVLTLIALGLLSQLGQVDGVFVTHFGVWSVNAIVSKFQGLWVRAKRGLVMARRNG